MRWLTVRHGTLPWEHQSSAVVMSKQRNLSYAVWQIFDGLRGVLDLSRSRDYVLALVFLKFVSDTHDVKRAEYEKKYAGDLARVERAMSREPFRVPEVSRFAKLLEARGSQTLGQALNKACFAIEDATGNELPWLSKKVDFESTELGDPNERVDRLSQMITVIGELDLAADSTAAGEVYEEILRLYATSNRRGSGEFYTPREVTQLLAKLVEPVAGDRIYDPCCGTGGFLLQAAQEVGSQNFALFGQEKNASAWAIGQMNLALRGLDTSFIERSDSLGQPLKEGQELMRFDVVLTNPPFGDKDWSADAIEYERGGRFRWGMPPKHRSDYAYISHAVESLKSKSGRAAIVVSLGVLFRSGSEGLIRRRLVEENLLEGVIALPSSLFSGTGIPVAVLLFRTGREDESVFFIDASREFASEKLQHRLRDEDVEKIVSAWADRKDIAKYARRVTRAEIEANEFNLNLSLYRVDPIRYTGGTLSLILNCKLPPLHSSSPSLYLHRSA
jgi:type I restriction enzyme M protein